MDSEITLGYWQIRGLGQVPRLLLNYTKANWKNKFYTDRDTWFNKDKKNMSLSFPNLPYLIEGDFKITESMAINRYIINRSEHK
jgi:glutathione S-transferase